MKKLLLTFIVFNMLFGCSLGFGEKSKSELDVCGLSMVKSKFPDLLFEGPLSFGVADAMYKDKVSVYETKRMKEEWTDFKKEAEYKSCIYYFTSNEKSWQSLSGTKGFVIVREGVAVNMVITTKS